MGVLLCQTWLRRAKRHAAQVVGAETDHRYSADLLIPAQTVQMDMGLPAPTPVKPGHPGQPEQPYVHSPVAAHEPPPVRNMSTSTASTSGSVELPLRAHEQEPSQSAGTFMSSQVRLLWYGHEPTWQTSLR